MTEAFGRIEPYVTHLFPCSFEDSVRVGQFRAEIKSEVHVARIGGDVAERSAFAAGELKHDYLRIDRVENLLGFWSFRENHLA
jgi:hypothetical protein